MIYVVSSVVYMDEQQSPPSPPHVSNKWKETLSTIGIILLAPLVALFLINFIFQSYQVDGPSMEPTLQNGDRLIVSKTGKTWARITGNDYVPKRYEIIIFNHTGEFSGSSQVTEKQLIKRVIGLPGDRVVVKDGVVRVYNNEHPDGYLIDSEGPERNAIANTPDNGHEIDLTVKKGELFVMGDNREQSLDSRSFGPIRSDDVVGHLSLRIYPFDKFERF